MTAEGRLLRGKANYDSGKFLDNSETIEYVKTLTKKSKPKSKGVKKMEENKKNKLMLPDEVIMEKIYFIRGEKVMLDRDLAKLYGVETKYLKRQVRRNILRFPDDFMFQLTKEEFKYLKSQIATSSSGLRSCFLHIGNMG